MSLSNNILFERFSFKYSPSQHLFKDFNLSLPKNQWLGILGPSGVGKSTLLHALANFIQEKHSALHIGLLPQQNTLLPWLKVIDNVCIGSLLREENLSDRQKNAKNILKQVGLENCASAYPQQLSGGQAQRVIIARTLYEKSDVIFMDEPFASLDAITKQQVQDVAHHAFQDKTVLLVTHDPLEALRLCDHIIVLQGQPVSYDAPIILNSKAPRRLNDQEIVLHYEILMEKLKHAAKKFD